MASWAADLLPGAPKPPRRVRVNSTTAPAESSTIGENDHKQPHGAPSQRHRTESHSHGTADPTHP